MTTPRPSGSKKVSDGRAWRSFCTGSVDRINGSLLQKNIFSRRKNCVMTAEVEALLTRLPRLARVGNSEEKYRDVLRFVDPDSGLLSLLDSSFKEHFHNTFFKDDPRPSTTSDTYIEKLLEDVKTVLSDPDRREKGAVKLLDAVQALYDGSIIRGIYASHVIVEQWLHIAAQTGSAAKASQAITPSVIASATAVLTSSNHKADRALACLFQSITKLPAAEQAKQVPGVLSQVVSGGMALARGQVISSHSLAARLHKKIPSKLILAAMQPADPTPQRTLPLLDERFTEATAHTDSAPSPPSTPPALVSLASAYADGSDQVAYLKKLAAKAQVIACSLQQGHAAAGYSIEQLVHTGPVAEVNDLIGQLLVKGEEKGLTSDMVKAVRLGLIHKAEAKHDTEEAALAREAILQFSAIREEVNKLSDSPEKKALVEDLNDWEETARAIAEAAESPARRRQAEAVYKKFFAPDTASDQLPKLLALHFGHDASYWKGKMEDCQAANKAKNDELDQRFKEIEEAHNKRFTAVEESVVGLRGDVERVERVAMTARAEQVALSSRFDEMFAAFTGFRVKVEELTHTVTEAVAVSKTAGSTAQRAAEDAAAAQLGVAKVSEQLAQHSIKLDALTQAQEHLVNSLSQVLSRVESMSEQRTISAPGSTAHCKPLDRPFGRNVPYADPRGNVQFCDMVDMLYLHFDAMRAEVLAFMQAAGKVKEHSSSISKLETRLESIGSAFDTLQRQLIKSGKDGS